MAGIIGNFATASGLAGLLFLAGLAVRLVGGRERLSWGLLLSSGLMAIAFSTGPVATLLLSPLEYEYPMLEDPTAQPAAKTIVVLTGYAADDPLMPLSSRVNSSSAYRLLEAQRIYQTRPDCDVIISGSPSTARIMSELLVQLGVPESQVRVDQAAHTYVSAGTLGNVLKNSPFFLVTSAGHMPRAMGVFQKQGLLPIPAPTDYQLPKHFRKAQIMPTAQHLLSSDLAVHEHVGNLWYRLTGRI